MRGYIYDSIMVLAVFTGIVFGLCGRYLDRRCDHCKKITYYIPLYSNEIVPAKESILDRVLDDWRNGGVYHWDCLPYHDFRGCNCGS